MFVDRSREKLLNAIAYFAQYTKYCGRVKLFRLLYKLDCEHFKQTGRTVTGLTYQAWKFGPVPAKLNQEWDSPEEDFEKFISIEVGQSENFKREIAYPHMAFDRSHFSKRELRLLTHLVERYANAKDVEITDTDNGAWAKIWALGKGFGETIPFEMVLTEDMQNRDEILDAAKEYQAIHREHVAFQ